MSFATTSQSLLSLACFSRLLVATSAQAIDRPNPATQGAWTGLIELPLIPVAAYVVPAFPESSKVLFFSSWGNTTFGEEGGRTQFANFDYLTKNATHREVADTRHDMFCPAISALQDGRILISGGSDANKTTFYNPIGDDFTIGPQLNTPRGYQSSTTLSDGRVFTIGGAFSEPIVAKDGEVYDPATNLWTPLPDANVGPMLTDDNEGVWREDNHAWLFGWKNGSVFQAGPSKAQNWYGATGRGSQSPAGIRDNTTDAMSGIAVMYEPGKILTAGGSQDYTDSDATARSHITTIDAPGTAATVERVADMAAPRAFANAVVLPSGEVFVTGGQRRAIVFTDTNSVLRPEIFDPVNKTWTLMAAAAVARNYHSTAILLPDATVFSGGGGLCYVNQSNIARPDSCDDSVDHLNGQIFMPPYLYNTDGSPAVRPTVEVASKSVQVGGVISATVDAEDAELVLIRMGTVTHSINTDQRRIPLTSAINGTAYTATLGKDSGILLPGHYYLFAIAAGVPSIAQTLQIIL